MEKNKKILVINQGNTSNIGDIAINETIKNFLGEDKVDFAPYWDEVSIFGENYNNPFIKKIIKKLYKISFFSNFFMSKFIKKNYCNKKYKAIVIGGGDLLSAHAGFNCAFYNWTKFFFNRNTNIYVIGVSANDKLPTKKQLLYKEALGRCEYISARDSYSQAIISKKYGIDCDFNPDVVFAYNKVMNKNINTYNQKNKNLTLVVPMKYNNALAQYLGLKSEEEYFEYIEEKIELAGNKEIIITTTVADDKNTAMNLYEFLSKRKNYIVKYNECDTLENYTKIVSDTNYIISGRMHAMILGMLYKNEILTINHNIKLETFSKEYKGNIDIEEIIKSAYDGLLKLYDRIKEVEN